MDELIVKVLKGEATDFEVRQLDRWRGASADHESEFKEVEELWAQASEASRPEIPPPPPLSEILEEGERWRRQASVRLRVRAILSSPFVGPALSAAAVAALLFIGLRSREDSVVGWSALSPVETSIGSGEVTTLGLSDGSVVRLAQGSRIEFPPSSQGRNVVMDGKAFFAVASGEDPFVVGTQLGVVRVTGTRFEVRVDETRLRVIVLEGLVDVEGSGETVRVGPGQVAYLSHGEAIRVEEGGDLRAFLDWPGGLLVFQETPFREVAREVGTHFGVAFEVPPGELAGHRITAWFGEETLEEVVRGVCMVVGARCDLADDHVVVR